MANRARGSPTLPDSVCVEDPAIIVYRRPSASDARAYFLPAAPCFAFSRCSRCSMNIW